ncbi:acyl-CoA Delta(11) desaturase-like isoform X1 [Leguminivora glycinivorella]|uniref:acyl-CoA Delta(11) desaturase-like isoform X1 n=1 Tax=Leguminivora glycinivorella TaxID=1035111 RepID=UPI00200E0D18|nr:acyl-CoA Delta(11) desaturase-like isoform X1 [Leguminivora glycinivorella]XP_048000570.1 acyl-CoA Delta(11) desaturase-like isoform X1 [Leguminivora glycinivorella]
MAPNIKEKARLVDEAPLAAPAPEPPAPGAGPREYALRLHVALKFAYWHLGALYGLWLAPQARLATVLFNMVLFVGMGLGTSVGAHRLWAHRAFKAAAPLQALLLLLQTLASQHCVVNWVRDHRLHHKYTDSDADPYSARRGWWFSHAGWVLYRKHPEVVSRGGHVDVSDLMANPLLRFQKKYYYRLNFLLAFVLPVVIPVFLWGESWRHAHCLQLLSLLAISHLVFCINSLAHASRPRHPRRRRQPYDTADTSVQSDLLYALGFGEGHHNYHHAFPSDYRLSESGMKYFNYTNALIEFFERIGWAWDLKRASPEMIAKRALRTGDGTHPRSLHVNDGFSNSP